LYCGKSDTIICATFVIFKKQPKVSSNRPIWWIVSRRIKLRRPINGRYGSAIFYVLVKWRLFYFSLNYFLSAGAITPKIKVTLVENHCFYKTVLSERECEYPLTNIHTYIHTYVHAQLHVRKYSEMVYESCYKAKDYYPNGDILFPNCLQSNYCRNW
jgi:hypothetical protein